MQKDRLGIYFFYDEKGIVRNFVLKFVDGLQQVCDEVWIVVNGKLTKESKKRLETVTKNIWIRENEGFDVWAYKTMMEKLGWSYIYEFNELVLCNFTCYGPVYPFKEMFDEMGDRDCDFWGAVKHPEQNAYLLPNQKGYIYEHLMSYFIVVKDRLLHSDEFKYYWKDIPPIKSKRESTGYHETVFTKHFEDLGYSSDSYVDLKNYEGRCYNSSIMMADELLIEDRCPLVKRRAFCFPEYEGLLQISLGDRAKRLMDYIDTQTDYDVDLIWEDMLQTQRMSLLHNNLMLTNTISSLQTCTSKKASKKLYLIYIESQINADVLYNFITANKNIDNLILLCSSDVIGEYCRSLFKNIDTKNITIISSDVSRNALAYLLKYKNKIEEADYICCILNYNIVKQQLLITEEDYIRYLYDCLIKNEDHISNIIEQFEKQERLGMLIPSAASFSVYFGQAISKNKHNIKSIKSIYERLELDVPLDDGSYYNNEVAFWARKESLLSALEQICIPEVNEILSKTDTLSLFLPMYIQQNGYYTGSVLSEEMSSTILTHYSFMKSKTMDAVNEKSGNYYWRFWDLVNDIRSSKNEIRNVYITPSKKEIVNTPFSCREIIRIIINYIHNKSGDIRRYFSSKKNKTKQNLRIFTYLRNVCVENERLVLYFMSGTEDINKSYLLVNSKKYFSKKDLTNGQKELIEYVKEYTNSFAAFFEVPLSEVKNQLISLYSPEENQIFFRWASGISYNALELQDFNLYSRMTDNGYLIQEKKEYIAGILRCKDYSLKEKMLFLFMRFNPFHFITVMSENLSANDNTFELFKYCFDKGERVYYLVSEQIYNAEKEKYRKRMVIHNSLKHHIIMLFSKRWIGSFSLRLELFPTSKVFSDIHYNMLPANWIFIPHGMAVGDKSVAMLYKYAWDNPRMTFANSKDEAAAYADMYGFQNVTYLGSPRMDKWVRHELNDHEIFIFFTWRLGLSKGRTAFFDSFEESDYFLVIMKIIESVRSSFPDYIINYAFHHEIVRAGYDKVLTERLKDYDINFIYLNSIEGGREFNSHFASSKYLITDFSSVAYDFSYKKNAIAIYYLEDQFIAHHYPLNQKFYDIHLGYIVKNCDELTAALRLEHPTKQMQERKEAFFDKIDGCNSERVYRAIFKNEKLNEFLNVDIALRKPYAPKRLGIYFFYDADGIADQYVFYYLEQLKVYTHELCVVVNGDLKQPYINHLKQVADKLLIRENVGFDSWAYKEAIESYGYEYIAENFDELLLNNFTNFGPVYPFDELFDLMDNKECDFWGHNRYHAEKNQKFENVMMVDHLQSYFMVFRNTILSSKHFKKYWKTLKCPKTYLEAIEFHEIRCTRYFEELGFISAEFIPNTAYKDICNNAPMYQAFSQLQKYRSPFLKRKIFFLDGGRFMFPLREEQDVYTLLKYIKENTDYDIGLIYENIERTQDLDLELDDIEKEKVIALYNESINQADNEKEMMTAYEIKNQIYDREKFIKTFGQPAISRYSQERDTKC